MIYMVLAAQAIVVPFLETFKEFPPRQKAAQLHHRSGIGEDERGCGAEVGTESVREDTASVEVQCCSGFERSTRSTGTLNLPYGSRRREDTRRVGEAVKRSGRVVLDEPARDSTFNLRRGSSESPGLLRTVSVSSADRQPREISTALAGPAKTPRGLSSLLACTTLSGRPIHPRLPAAGHLRRPSMPCVGPRLRLPASTSAQRVCAVPRNSSENTT